MTRKWILFASLLCGCVVASLVGVMAFTGHRADASITVGHPDVLTNASEQEVGQVALAATARNFPTRSGTAQIALGRRVARDDLPKLGLQGIPQTTIEEPPLMLVIIRGDFGKPNLPGTGNIGQQFKYIGYVYDLWAGIPTLVIASPDGHEFRMALNDPSLPMSPPVVATAPVPSQGPLLHYGQIVPGVTPQMNRNSTPTAAQSRGTGTTALPTSAAKP